MVFIFENGKGVRVPLKAYETKGNRRKLTGAYSDASPLVGIFHEREDAPFEIMMVSDNDRAIIFKSSLIPQMATRASKGVLLMTLGRREKRVVRALSNYKEVYGELKGYHKNKLPATGFPIGDRGEQLSLNDKL